MKNQTIHATLAELKVRIDQLDTTDAAAKARLESLVASLEHGLRVPDDHEHQQNLLQEISETITQFEIEHPRITGILNDIMMALSNLGI